MITSQMSKMNFWVTSYSQIERIIAALNVYMEALSELGYVSSLVRVGGGVHESDTGYESFSRRYNSFEEMKKHLLEDFAADANELDGMWYNTLNFETILVSLEKDDIKGTLSYSRGEVELDCGEDEAVIEERIREAWNDKIAFINGTMGEP